MISNLAPAKRGITPNYRKYCAAILLLPNGYIPRIPWGRLLLIDNANKLEFEKTCIRFAYGQWS